MDDAFRWDPVTYFDWVRQEIPAYDRLQDELVKATRRTSPRHILDLGSGSGETARRILNLHPHAELTGVDASEQMLAAARDSLKDRSVTFNVAQLEDPLPDGPFDLITSALAIHHLAAADKQTLFAHIASSLRPGGRLVLADVVIPEDPSDAQIELSEYDRPSSLSDQLDWLRSAGLQPNVCWTHQDLAVVAADRR